MKSRQHRIYEIHLKNLKKLRFPPEIRFMQDKVNYSLGLSIKAMQAEQGKPNKKGKIIRDHG